jgi:hypothetical protein
MPDIVGTEFASLEDAREEAVHLAGTLLREHSKEFWTGESWHMEVHDEADRLLFTLAFTAKAEPLK